MCLCCRVSSAKAGVALIARCLHRLFLSRPWFVFTHISSFDCLSDALFFNTGTISVFKSVLQFNCIYISECWPTIRPHWDKQSPAAFHVPLLHLSAVSSHLSLRAGLLLHTCPGQRNRLPTASAKGTSWKQQGYRREHERQKLQTISGSRSRFFVQQNCTFKHHFWDIPDFGLEPKNRTKASILSPFDMYYFNHINYSILTVLGFRQDFWSRILCSEVLCEIKTVWSD